MEAKGGISEFCRLAEVVEWDSSFGNNEREEGALLAQSVSPLPSVVDLSFEASKTYMVIVIHLCTDLQQEETRPESEATLKGYDSSALDDALSPLSWFYSLSPSSCQLQHAYSYVRRVGL